MISKNQIAGDRQSGKLAVILHADIAGSTTLVQQDEHLAHARIQDTFRRFRETIIEYHGRVRELRGDALLADFERASDAVSATLAFQVEQAKFIASLDDNIRPTLRVGIAMGEVVIADNTVTGEGVVLAQRVEQLAEPGGVCITGAINEALPTRLPFDQKSLGEQKAKGFEKAVRVYQVTLKSGKDIPGPGRTRKRKGSNTLGKSAAIAAIVLLIVGGVVYWFQPWSPEQGSTIGENMALALPDKPSIAVLPFTNMSDDTEQEYFVDGITGDIITALSEFKFLFIIASNSSFAYKGKPVKVQQVSRDLGVRYVLEGSVQRAGNRVRINAQLIDATTGKHLWAERYDRDAQRLFDIQDEIVTTIVATLAFKVDAAERERVMRKGPSNLDAYDYWLRGRNAFFHFTKEANAEAGSLYRKAIELDPSWARPYGYMAWVHVQDFRYRLERGPGQIDGTRLGVGAEVLRARSG